MSDLSKDSPAESEEIETEVADTEGYKEEDDEHSSNGNQCVIQDTNSSKPKRTPKLTVNEKVRLIYLHHEGKSYSELCRIFRCSKSTVSGVMKNQQLILETATKLTETQSKIQCRVKPTSQFPEIEKILCQWIFYNRAKGIVITDRNIRERARDECYRLYGKQWSPSNGWIAGFKNRMKRKECVTPLHPTSTASINPDLVASAGSTSSSEKPDRRGNNASEKSELLNATNGNHGSTTPSSILSRINPGAIEANNKVTRYSDSNNHTFSSIDTSTIANAMINSRELLEKSNGRWMTGNDCKMNNYNAKKTSMDSLDVPGSRLSSVPRFDLESSWPYPMSTTAMPSNGNSNGSNNNNNNSNSSNNNNHSINASHSFSDMFRNNIYNNVTTANNYNTNNNNANNNNNNNNNTTNNPSSLLSSSSSSSSSLSTASSSSTTAAAMAAAHAAAVAAAHAAMAHHNSLFPYHNQHHQHHHQATRPENAYLLDQQRLHDLTQLHELRRLELLATLARNFNHMGSVATAASGAASSAASGGGVANGAASAATPGNMSLPSPSQPHLLGHHYPSNINNSANISNNTNNNNNSGNINGSINSGVSSGNDLLLQAAYLGLGMGYPYNMFLHGNTSNNNSSNHNNNNNNHNHNNNNHHLHLLHQHHLQQTANSLDALNTHFK